jgi:hypothetical protein
MFPHIRITYIYVSFWATHNESYTALRNYT